MQSKRKRAARCQDESAENLLQAFDEGRSVDREGKYPVLRWLVKARCIANTGLPHNGAHESKTTIPHLLNKANANYSMCTQATLDELERCVVNVLMGHEEVPYGHLSYAAHFFKWWAKVAQINCTPPLQPSAPAHAAKSWLDPQSLERSLVVPDVRRAAIKIMQMLSIRPGDFEIAAQVSGIKSKSWSSVLQTLRTGEWNVRVQQTLMYGTLTDIYNAGMLDAVYFSIIDSRYVGRLGFQWVNLVLEAAGQHCMSSSAPWPRIIAHNHCYLLYWNGQHSIHSSADEAYCAWAATCLDLGGVIGGRYDVRKCTI